MLKSFFLKLVDGFIYGMGFCLFTSLFVGIAGVATGHINLHRVTSFFVSQGVVAPPPVQVETEPTTVKKEFYAPRIEVPEGYTYQEVSTHAELRAAVESKEIPEQGLVVILAPGHYEMKGPLYVRANNVFIKSSSGDPYDTTISWSAGDHRNKGGNLFRVSGNNFYLDGVTLTGAKNHLIQIVGEQQASFPIINNCILQNAYEQFVKVSYNKNTPEKKSVGGIISNSIFQYTKGIAPNFYTGGVDAIGAVDWVIKNNIFRDIASPSNHIAQHAVHFWVNSSGTQVINNLFIDNDRAIGFGMPLNHNAAILEYSHKGGVISHNVIYHSDNGDPFGDTGIILEASMGAEIYNNAIYMEHSYPRAIEYRFTDTKDVRIFENKVNKAISSRDGGSAVLDANTTNLEKVEFLNELSRIQQQLGVIHLYEPL